MTAVLTLHLLHQSAFGAVAATGFGVLFNFGLKDLAHGAAMGALALALRTLCLSLGGSLEAASFLAALVASSCALMFFRHRGAATRAIALVGCIPMVPGAALNQALLGFLALSAPHPVDIEATTIRSIQAMLNVVFTLGAIGAGLAIPSQIARDRGFRRAGALRPTPHSEHD
jgi:uncharacterized membrane protein YjjB (DUF3815 family)